MKSSPLVWSMLQRFGTDGIRFGFLLVLALLLNPEDFGLVAIASLWVDLMATFSELGLGAALIQRKSLLPEHLSSTFFLNVGLGAVLSALGVLGSGLIALIFRAPEVRPVVALLSVGFLLTSVSLTQQALAYRELRIKDIAVRDMVAAAFGGICAVVLAYRGFGVWSLVIQSLATSAAASLLLWRMSSWRPRLAEASIQAIRDLWGYSSSIFLFGLVKYVAQNTDKLLVGRLLGTSPLGLYSFAKQLVVYPASALAAAIGAYQFPKFSRMQEDLPSVQSSYLWFNRATVSVVVPALVVFAAVSSALVPGLFGEKWAAAVPLAQWFTLVALGVTVISPLGNLMKALGRPNWLLWWSMGLTIATTLTLWMGSSWGVAGVVAGLAFGHLLSVPVVDLLTSKLLGLRTGKLFRSLTPSLLSGTVAIAVLWICYTFPPFEGLAGVAFRAVVGLTSYCIALLVLDRPVFALAYQRIRGPRIRHPGAGTS